MICKVKNAIEKYKLIDDNVSSIAVGFSGGADSVCLLHILSSLKDEYGIILKAVHVNHNIRGEEADADERFVRDFCKNIGVELLVFSVDVPSVAKSKKLSLEECGRLVRYECFEKAGCDAVAVAHTLSDSIETMLFNLARGTGVKGLGGISPARDPNIIRPLIDCTRKEIEEYCEKNGLDYVTDSTNLSDDYTRNHIRHNIVPAFEKINSGFENAFLRAMSNVREECDFVESCVYEALDRSRTEDGFSVRVLNTFHDTVVKKCILEILKEVMQKPPEAKHVDAFFKCVKTGAGKIEIGKDLYLCVNDDIISFCHSETETPEWKSSFINAIAKTPYGSYHLESGSMIDKNSFDAEKISSDLFLSSRLAGDEFTFSERGVTKSLKKLFNEMKIPAKSRNKVAVLHDGKNVVWIEDIGVNAAYIPDKKSQKIITIKKDG